MVGESQKLCRPHVAQASIIGERLREILLPMPPPHEQTGIAALLHSVQRAALVQAQILSRAATLKSRLMGQLFTRGLRGEAQKETPHGLVPDHWAIRLLEHCAAVQTGVTKGRKLDGGDLIDVPYLRVANVQSGFLDLSEIKHIKIRREELARYRLQADDIVLTEGGDLDKLGRGFIWRGEIEDCVHQNHIFAVRVDRTLLDPEYFAYLVQSAYGRSYFLMVGHKTTNLASINSTKLKAFPVLIPPLEEQREIAHILDAIDRKIDLHRRKRDVLDELFRSLLHKLMRGEIRVNDLSMPEITQ
jgi:type I restriction enzyme S subunit